MMRMKKNLTKAKMVKGAGVNQMIRAPLRLTNENVDSFKIAKKLQTGYHDRIRKHQPKFLEANKLRSIPKPLHEFQQRLAVDLLKLFEIRVGDLVQVRYGQDVGKVGVVLEVRVNKNQLVVEGCNVIDKVSNPRRGEPGQTSMTYVEAPIHVTNVAPVDPVTKTITQVKLRKMMTGELVRTSFHSGCAMPDPVPIANCKDAILYYKRNALKKMAKIPSIKLSTQQLRNDRAGNDALRLLAAQISDRQKRNILHSFNSDSAEFFQARREEEKGLPIP